MYIKVWMYLLIKAQHNEYKGLQRGQLYTSIPEIREACSHRVGFRKERPTKDQIFQIIEWLRKPHEGSNESNTKATMIATTKATHGMVITICNYSHYQNLQNYGSNDDGKDEKAANPSREQQQPDNINKNVKNDKNVKNEESIGRFTPPSVEDVAKYCEERRNGIDAESFVSFYASKGWMIGKNKMKDWKAAVRTWEQKRKCEQPKPYNSSFEKGVDSL